MSNVFTDPVGAIHNLFGGALGAGAATPGGGWLRDAVSKIPSMVVDKIVGIARNLGSSALGGGAAPSGAVSGWIAQALSILGWPMSYAAGLAQQIRSESGGNPRAVQHGYVDINTLTGNLAQGIMQVIPPTFRSYMLGGHGNPFNPVDNIIAGARYAMARYGAGWFAPGAHHNHGYDQGGLAQGIGMMPKYTTRPERVLSPDQTAAFERAMDNGFGGGTNNFYVTIDAKNVDDFNKVVRVFENLPTAARSGQRRIAGVR